MIAAVAKEKLFQITTANSSRCVFSTIDWRTRLPRFSTLSDLEKSIKIVYPICCCFKIFWKSDRSLQAMVEGHLRLYHGSMSQQNISIPLGQWWRQLFTYFHTEKKWNFCNIIKTPFLSFKKSYEKRIKKSYCGYGKMSFGPVNWCWNWVSDIFVAKSLHENMRKSQPPYFKKKVSKDI